MAATAPTPLRVVPALGVVQVLAWGCSYYQPAVLAAPMARDLGLPAAQVYLAFSAALLTSALAAPRAGRLIDRHGGRLPLAGSSVALAAGLLVLARATGAAGLLSGWLLMGAAMGFGLYEAAFSTLVRYFGAAARGPITGLTLVAGFASTVAWPLSAWMETRFGWRGACTGWALLQLALALPLNLSLPAFRAPQAASEPVPAAAVPAAVPEGAAARRTARLLALTFAATWFISTAVASHLPRMLQLAGTGAAAALALAALVGPAQVAGRLLEFGALRRLHPLLSGRMAALAHPAGALLLLVAGAPAALPFVLLHGAGNGILTIANGTLPALLLGTEGYGARQGRLMLPARIGQALAPPVFALCLEHLGAGALVVSALCGLAAFGALWALRGPD